MERDAQPVDLQPADAQPADAQSPMECRDCGLLQQLPAAGDGALLTCTRCDALLRQVRRASVPLATLCAALGLVLLAFANLFPLASVTAPGGKTVTADVAGSVARLEHTGAIELLVAVALTLLVFPAAKLVLVLAMVVAGRRGRVPRWLRMGFTALPWFSNWGMVDVFLLGAMIAIFRMRSQGFVAFHPAVFALGGFALCSLALDAALDLPAFWQRVPLRRSRHAARQDDHAPASEPSPADAQERITCHHCGLVAAGWAAEPCARCERRLSHRTSDSVPRTWAFVTTGFIMLIPANALPVMTVTKLGEGGPSTIWSGVLELIHMELYGLATIVFLASIVIPVAKLLALCVLLIMTQRGSGARLRLRTWTYRAVAVIGRWSMVDIFATMTLVALARFGALGQVLPESGALAFCAVVFVTMIAAEQFDPRLMWDAAEQRAAAATGPRHGHPRDGGPAGERRAPA